MNNYQISKHSSYKLMVFEADKYAKIIKVIPKFEKALIRLKAICGEIDSIKALQEKGITGVASDKHQTIDKLMPYMIDVAGALQSYALEKKDNILFESINYNDTEFARLTHDEIITVCSHIIEAAEKLKVDDLAAEGISPEELTVLKKLYEEFKSKNQAPKQAIIDRTNHTEKLRLLFDEAATIKRDTLDRLISQFKRKDPEFYLKFTAASNVVYKRGRKTTNGDITSTETEEVKA